MPQTINLRSIVGGDEASDNKIEARGVAFKRLLESWELPRDLMGGTRAMRKAGAKWLFHESEETLPAYNSRLSRSVLFNGYRDTVRKLSGKPFSRTVNLKAELPDALQPMEANVDRMGGTLTNFAKELMRDAVAFGKSHFLVDFQRAQPRPDGRPRTRADEEGLHPYFVHIKATQLFNWDHEILPNGDRRLTEIRWEDEAIKKVGEFGQKTVRVIKRWTRDQFWVYERDPDDQDEFVEVSSGPHTFGDIPLCVLYTNKTGFMQAEPPMEDLAWLNLAHWQSQSDQRNLLRVARVPTMLLTGFTDEEVEDGFTIGPSNVIASTSSESDGKFVEHSGSAIEAGRQDILDLEEKMERMGMQPMSRRETGNQTATARAMDGRDSASALQEWVRDAEGVLREGFEKSAQWISGGAQKVELDPDFAVEIFNEFELSDTATEDLQILQEDNARGVITDETYLNELARRGKISSSVDIADELERLRSEPPDTAGFGAPSPPARDDEADDEEDPGDTPEDEGREAATE